MRDLIYEGSTASIGRFDTQAATLARSRRDHLSATCRREACAIRAAAG